MAWRQQEYLLGRKVLEGRGRFEESCNKVGEMRMSPLPMIDEANRARPVSYDPRRNKFIYYDELIARTEKIVPLKKLTHAQVKKLVIERTRTAPDLTMHTPSGETRTRDDIIREISQETAVGKKLMEADVMSINRLHRQIERDP